MNYHCHKMPSFPNVLGALPPFWHFPSKITIFERKRGEGRQMQKKRIRQIDHARRRPPACLPAFIGPYFVPFSLFCTVVRVKA